MAEVGTPDQPLRVAVVGSGPSGFYATEALFKQGLTVKVDLFERLPAPFGLVRNGVAPDHPKLKQAIQVYEKIAETPGFGFLGNVTIGRDITVDELRAHYHAVVFTCGAETDRRLGIRGEDLPGSHTATEFVGWYNGHPDYRDRSFDLSHEAAAIIGQGNVAIDVARILAKTVDELKHTDIAEHALDALAESRIRDIFIIGRRGPMQAKFTHIELRELGELEDCTPIVKASDLALNAESEAELADKNSRTSVKNMETMKAFAGLSEAGKRRRCHLVFLQGPVRLEGSQRLERVVLEKNVLSGPAFKQSAKPTGETVALDCGILFRSIGYRGVPIPGLPFDERAGVLPNQDGRIIDQQGEPIPGLYTAGWIKRGPTGIIGTNRADAVATVKSLIDDLPKLKTRAVDSAGNIADLIQQKNLRRVSYADWSKIDQSEIGCGSGKGKPREKYTRVSEMLGILG